MPSAGCGVTTQLEHVASVGPLLCGVVVGPSGVRSRAHNQRAQNYCNSDLSDDNTILAMRKRNTRWCRVDGGCWNKFNPMTMWTVPAVNVSFSAVIRLHSHLFRGFLSNRSFNKSYRTIYKHLGVAVIKWSWSQLVVRRPDPARRVILCNLRQNENKP